jgi:xanthine dehydrogenase YagR molybdenum-binding subunit
MSSMRMDKNWPKLEDTRLLGKRVSRLDGPDKVTGRAKYTYDQNPKDLLYAKFAWCPYGHAKIKSIDVSKAAKMPGVVRAFELVKPGDEISYAGVEVAVVAADTEERAREAAKAIVVTYDVLPHNAEDKDLDAVAKEFRGRPREKKSGDADKAFAEAKVTSTGRYGCAQITHCCLESHGSVSQFKDDEHVVIWTSTQAISGIPEQVASITGAEQKNVEAICHVLGGGFGSKFSLDSWDATALRIAEETKRPVKVMLERDQELMIAGSRPSGYADVRIAAQEDGTITGWVSEGVGFGGCGRWLEPDAAVCLRGYPERACLAHRHRHARGPGSRVACAEPSAERAGDDGRARRPRGEARHGSARAGAQEPRVDRPARRHLLRRARHRRSHDAVVGEVEAA